MLEFTKETNPLSFCYGEHLGDTFQRLLFLPIAKARKGCSLILHIENLEVSLEVKPIELPPPTRPQPP